VAGAFFQDKEAAAAPQEAADEAEIYSVNRLAPAFRAPASPEPVRWIAPPEGRDEAEIEFSWAREMARHVGTVAHRWLQCIAQDELRGWDATRIESLGQTFARELARRGVRPAELKASAEMVAAALKNSLADERGRWVLGPHAEARSEHRMRVRTPEGTRTFVMDRVFSEEDGTRWVVDYKTSRHEGADLEAFLDQERERYASQLASYAEAIAGSRQGLYFPLLRGWRER
jgi:hypothetical protein